MPRNEYHNYYEQNEINSLIEDDNNAEDTQEYMLKLLLPCQIAWCISSRNDLKVAWMFEKFGTDVRLSKNDDFYPGTTERVCLIFGQLKQIDSTLEWILNAKNDKNDEDIQQMKILIPKTSVGILMQRGGAGIKALCERLDIDLQIPNDSNPILREVCGKLAGKKNNVIKACMKIAKTIKKDPFSGICRNVSYEESNIYLKRKEHNNISNGMSMPRMIPPQLQQEWINQRESMQQQYYQQQQSYQQQPYQQYQQEQIFHNQNYNQQAQQYSQRNQQQQQLQPLLQSLNHLFQQNQQMQELKPQQQTPRESTLIEIKRTENEPKENET